jgi:hypothetical protein
MSLAYQALLGKCLTMLIVIRRFHYTKLLI